MKYDKVLNIDGKVVKPIKRKNIHFLSCILICLTTFSILGLGLIKNSSIGQFILRVTSYWTPKPEDMGKIKFVNYITDKNSGDGIFIVSKPFKVYYANNISNTKLEVYGLGDTIVLSSVDGTIKNILYADGKYSFDIVSGSVCVCLENIDNVCIKENEQVSVGQKIAVSNNSKILFSIEVSGKKIELAAGGVGDVFFE